jgi:hypothetical protein
MIRTGALLLLVTAAWAFGTPITLQSNGSAPTCSGSGTDPTLPGADTFCTGVTPLGGSLESEYVIPNGEIPDIANGGGAWEAPPGDGATWISYENTGWVGTVGDWNAVIELPNADCPTGEPITKGGSCQPNAEFFEVFSVTTNSILNLSVWADDSAQVFLINDSTPMTLSNATMVSGAPGNCAPTGYVSCQTGITLANDMPLAPGTYTLEFDVYQTGGGEYGLMYDGTVDPTPEPEVSVLVGGGLVMLALIRRKRAR